MKQIERIDDTIKFFGSMTSADAIPRCGIGNFSARMSDAMKVYPIKRVAVKRKLPNRYGERPIYYRYYYEKDKVVFPKGEDVIKWLDEDE